MWARQCGAACAAIGFVLLLALPPLPARAQSDVYQWTDEEGRVHFGDQVPDGARDAQVRKTPLRPPIERDPGRSSSAASHVESVLARRAFRAVETTKSGLTYSFALPREWSQLAPEPRVQLSTDIKRSWTTAQIHDVFVRDQTDLPWLTILFDPEISAEELRQLEDPLGALGLWLGGMALASKLRHDPESGGFTVEFLVDDAGERVAIWMGVVPTTRGGLVLMSMVWESELEAYRPLFLHMLRSVRIPERLRPAFDPIPDEEEATGPVLGAGPSLGIATWMVCALLLLMLHSARPGAWLEVFGGGVVVAVGFAFAVEFARTPEEVRSACLALGNLLLGSLLVGWAIAVRNGTMSAPLPIKLAAATLGVGVVAVQAQGIGVELAAKIVGVVVLVYFLLFRERTLKPHAPLSGRR
jgi:hypothetical protein